MAATKGRGAATTQAVAGSHADEAGHPNRSDLASRRFVTILTVIATALVAVLISPFATAFFAAAVFAAVLGPVQRWLTGAFGRRPHLAAGVITLAIIVVLVVPVTLVSMSVLDEASHWQDWVVTTAHYKGLEGLVAPVPEPLRSPVRALVRLLPSSVLSLPPEGDAPTAEEPASASDPATLPGAPAASQLGTAAGVVTRVVAGLAHVVVMLGILIVALFFLLAEGERLVAYLLDLFPLAKRTSRAMLTSFREITVAVLLSTFVTALIQTAVACIGYLIAGVPSLALMLFLTFLMAFVPVIGATGVVTAAGIVLWVSGDVGLGIFLTAWGLLAVGLIDNFVKPLLVRGRTPLAGGVVFFSMLCGLAVFGPTGIVAGPLIVTFFMAVARIAARQNAQPTAG